MTSHRVEHPEAQASGVSWSAVSAGAFVTAALYLSLLSLGTGLGLSSVSVWSKRGGICGNDWNGDDLVADLR